MVDGTILCIVRVPRCLDKDAGCREQCILSYPADREPSLLLPLSLVVAKYRYDIRGGQRQDVIHIAHLSVDMAKTTTTFFERTSFRAALPGRREDLVLRQLIGARLIRQRRPCLPKKAEKQDSTLGLRQFRFATVV